MTEITPGKVLFKSIITDEVETGNYKLNLPHIQEILKICTIGTNAIGITISQEGGRKGRRRKRRTRRKGKSQRKKRTRRRKKRRR